MASEAFEHALVQGRAHFQRGDWRSAREAWEEGGRRTSGNERRVLEALSLWGAAVEAHLQAHGDAAERLLLSAIERLNLVRGDAWGHAEVVHDALLVSLEALRQPWTPQSHRWPDDPVEVASVELEHRDRCPFCGEPVLLVVAPEEAWASRYVEDCPACCRPLDVSVREGRVTLGRGDGSGAD